MSEAALRAPSTQQRQPFLRLASDARLARLAADGSTQAFATIYERHHQEIYRYCRSIVGNEHDARDALQNTMLKALRALEGETREISLRPWLFRIAHNESISLLRRRAPDASIEAASELTAVEADPETRQRLRNLISDLEQLAPRQRSALVMRELNGLEFDDIGTTLETSPAAAKQAVYEARMALHELEEGREVSCDEIRRTVSAEDRRLLRGRRVRAHLKACSDCRRFEQQTRERTTQLAALAPPLPLPIAIGILDGILGGGGGGGGIAGGMLGGGGLAGIGGATAAKLGIAGVMVLGAGVVALEENAENAPATARAAEAIENAGPATDSAGKANAARQADRRDAGRKSSPASEGRGDRSKGNGGGNGNGNRGGNGNGPQVAAATEHSPTGPPPGQGGIPPTQGGAPPGNSTGGSGGSTTGSGGGGPASTPPGHGGTPPGQGGVPPGLGTAPPGHGGPVPGNGGAAAPPHGGTPPGRGGTPPGQAATPSGGGSS